MSNTTINAPRVVDLRDFGAIPDNGLPDDAAFDQAKAALMPAVDAATMPVQRTIVLAGGVYNFDYPIRHDVDRLAIVSPYRDAVIKPNHCGPVFLVDRSAWNGRSVSPDHSFPLAGLLDATVPAGRMGVHSRGNAHVAFFDSPWDLCLDGRGTWSAIGDLTIDFALVTAPGGPLPTGPLFGIFDYGEGIVFRAYTQAPDRVVVLYATNTSALGRISFTVPANPKGLSRATVRLSPATRSHSAAVEGVWVAPVESVLPPTGTVFHDNELMPFQIFNFGEDVSVLPDGGHEPDIGLAGLRLTMAPVYVDGVVGARQARRDGIGINDLNRFYFGERSTLCYLDQDTATAGRPGNRDVRYRARDGTPGYGGWWAPGMGKGGDGNIGGPRYQGLTIKGAGYGTGIAIGRAYGATVRDCLFQGGSSAIGGPMMGPSWFTTIENITADNQHHYCISLRAQIASLRNLSLTPESGALLSVDTPSTIRDVFSNRQAAGIATVRIVGGGGGFGCSTLLSGWTHDNEGQGLYPSEAFVSVRRRGGGTPIRLALEESHVAQLGNNAALVKVTDALTLPGAGRRNSVSVRGVQVETPTHRATMDVPGVDKGWDVDLSGVAGMPEDMHAAPMPPGP